ncbi:MAG: DUF1640 domain-containing protein [Deltaproteobacteria bacterium]|nr:DUF1640 domain-containing protein [Deltaproteobacteria bacterium]
MAVPFDTLAYARRLKAAGFSEPQAEAQAEALAAAMTDTLATKSDLEHLGSELRQEMGAMREELRSELHREIGLLRSEMREMETRLTVRLGGMMVGGFGALAVLVEVL